MLMQSQVGDTFDRQGCLVVRCDTKMHRKSKFTKSWLGVWLKFNNSWLPHFNQHVPFKSHHGSEANDTTFITSSIIYTDKLKK